jgi:hypothetical protein
MLRDWLVPQLERMNLTGKVWFQQGGTPAHYAILVRQYLSDAFLDKWIGCGSSTLAAPLVWPPRIPDLSSRDNALWSIIKQDVYRKRYQTTEELKEAARNAFAEVTPAMLRRISHRAWRRIILCFDHDGVHADIIDSFIPLSNFN